MARVLSAAVQGIEGVPIQVEVDVSNGLPAFEIVGLPDPAVRESRERVRAALKNSGLDFPVRRITVNLAPGDLRKEGPSFDLPIAIGLLTASGQIPAERLADKALVGELSLDGSLRPIHGVLTMAFGLRQAGVAELVIPVANQAETSCCSGMTARPAEHLSQVVNWLRGGGPQVLPGTDNGPGRAADHEEEASGETVDLDSLDFNQVKGQRTAKRALEIAAAGGHNLLMIGPPGSGKTMLARRLPGILPDFSSDEALETSRIHSVAGILPPGKGLLRRRPFRSPHQGISAAGLIGGGSCPRPGEVSLAHGGVLFVDELPEFRRDALEALRGPLEDGEVTICRSGRSYRFPSRFMLLGGMNPCLCGMHGDPEKVCRCSPREIERYFGRLSGPILDRIDIHLWLSAIKYSQVAADTPEEPSAFVRTRVQAARERQRLRYRGIHCNAQMGPGELKEFCRLTPEGRRLMESAFNRLGLSMRAHDRILKLARTITDLDGAEEIEAGHLSEAIQYRSLDRRD